MSQEQDALRRELLKQALSAASARERGEVLQKHGPILEDEVPYLASKATSLFGNLRRNAVRLLALSRAPSAKVVLRQLVTDASDVEVWAVALAEFLDDPSAKQLVLAQPKHIEEALHHSDPKIAGVGMRAGMLAGTPGLSEQLEKKLLLGSRDEKHEVLSALATSGAGTLEPKLRDLLRSPPAWLSDFTSVYAALTYSADPTMAEDFRASLKSPKDHQAIDFDNALTFTRSRQPWLRALLLAMLQSDSTAEQNRGFGVLEFWGPEYEPQLLQVCARWLERMPDDEQQRRKYLATEPAYFGYLSKRSGKDFSPFDKEGMQSFVKSRR